MANQGLPGATPGNPLTGMLWGVYRGPYLNGDVPNPQPCRAPFRETRCVTLGIPPTTHTASPRWHLAPGVAGLAYRYVDAYVWGGRPWLNSTTGAVELGTALGLPAAMPW